MTETTDVREAMLEMLQIGDPEMQQNFQEFLYGSWNERFMVDERGPGMERLWLHNQEGVAEWIFSLKLDAQKRIESIENVTQLEPIEERDGFTIGQKLLASWNPTA